MTRSLSLSAIVLCVVACFSAGAQESRGPDGGTRNQVSGIDVMAIPNRPFAATDAIDWTRTLADGSTVALHLDAKVARDSQGRVYRERHNFVPEGSQDRAAYEIHLMDPVSRTQLLCSGRFYRCVLSDFSPATYFRPTPEGSYADGTRTLSRENLGSTTIEGIYVSGTRETVTILPGAVGNEHAIVSTREYWYSDELQTNLAVTRIDPVEGKQVIRLSHISRTEPDPHLWDVPIGFRVRDVRPSRDSRR